LPSETTSVWPTVIVTVVWLSRSVTVIVEPVGMTLLVQVKVGAGAIPASCMPKLVEAPGAREPLNGALVAVAAAAETETVAFQAATRDWPAPRVQATLQAVAPVAAVFVTVTVTIWPPEAPEPHWESTRAVAAQSPVAASAVPVVATAVTAAMMTSPVAAANRPLREMRWKIAMAEHLPRRIGVLAVLPMIGQRPGVRRHRRP
jgi:hypothetical protein